MFCEHFRFTYFIDCTYWKVTLINEIFEMSSMRGELGLMDTLLDNV